jgi:predicted nuclease with TOPRIM domain
MSLLDEKLEEILNKANRLIEQNNQYKKVVQDLSARVKLLESENSELWNKLEEAQPNESGIALDKENLKKQIDKYIQDIDLSIQWLSDLE